MPIQTIGLATDRYNFALTWQTPATSSAYSSLSPGAPFLAGGAFKRWSSKMRPLSGSESPRYVSDRLSAVSNVPMQFLVSAGMAATILTATSFADLAKRGEAVGFVDAQQTASVVRATERDYDRRFEWMSPIHVFRIRPFKHW
jgi:hypothetical protein